MNKPKHREIPNGNVVGLSLSFCVSAILRGEVSADNIDMIISATNVPSDKWDSFLESYSRTYWHENPEEGIKIAKKLLVEDKIIQPRQMGMESHNIADGYWVEA